MGSGIASVAAQAGFGVKLYDRVPGAARAALIGLAGCRAGAVGREILAGDPERRRAGTAVARGVDESPLALRLFEVGVHRGLGGFEAVGAAQFENPGKGF
jgi:3-hydroxyacyl-CoA dehydrogenase